MTIRMVVVSPAAVCAIARLCTDIGDFRRRIATESFAWRPIGTYKAKMKRTVTMQHHAMPIDDPAPRASNRVDRSLYRSGRRALTAARRSTQSIHLRS
jgi:hypothetical protein